MNIRVFPLASLLLASGTVFAAPVAEHRAWTETYEVNASPRLVVSNIWGSVQVRAGAHGRITLVVTEFRSAPDQALFERSLDNIRIDVEADASGVSILVGDRVNRWQRRGDCRDCRVDYQFEIEVPPDTTLDVGTVKDGKVDIQGIGGTVSASNVNGPIRIDDIRECATVNSVNGPIAVGFTRAPLQDCRIETINGDITIDVPAGTGLDIALDLFNGEVSSQLPAGPFALSATATQLVEDGRTRYRIQQLAGVRIGAGGPLYSIASMNGDLRIKEHP